MDAISYFTLVWTVAALAGVSRAIHNGDYRGVGHSVSVAGLSGFLGFGVVSLVCGEYGSDGFDTMRNLGIASVVGLAGKEQTELISLILRHFTRRAGVAKEVEAE